MCVCVKERVKETQTQRERERERESLCSITRDIGDPNVVTGRGY